VNGRPDRPGVSRAMRPYAALFAVVLASPAAAQTAPRPAPPDRSAPAAPASSTTAAPAGTPTATVPPADLDRIRRRLQAGSSILGSASTAGPAATFRTSVTERVDISKFWGDPDAVAAFVRPRGGTWHHEFQDMVTPDEFKGYGGILGNGEKLQLAATSLAFAGAMKLLGIGVQQAKGALHDRTVRKAKEEVQRELEAFYRRHPEARPGAVPTPP
jgi:hypothetical protein